MAVDRPLQTPTPLMPGMEEEALEIEIVDPESVSIAAGGETIFEFDEDDLLYKQRKLTIKVPEDNTEMITKILTKVLDRREDLIDDQEE